MLIGTLAIASLGDSEEIGRGNASVTKLGAHERKLSRRVPPNGLESDRMISRGEGFRSATSLRKALVCTLVLVKVSYIIWFYAFGVGLNLGDTAAYINESSAEVFLERGDGIGFAYVATLIYSNAFSRFFVEVLTILVICKLVLKLENDRQAVLATSFLLFPTTLAFMTVASKELLVFLLLCLVYRARRWVGLPAFVVAAVLKPSFVVLALMPLIRRLNFVPLYFLFAFLLAAILLPFDRWSALYRSTFIENSSHFQAGNTTYSESGLFPVTPVLRVVGLDLGGFEPYGVAIGLMVFAVNVLVLYVLIRRYGPFRGSVMYLVFALAVMPYSIHNLGSTARYQAPLACALILNELVANSRHKNIFGNASFR